MLVIIGYKFFSYAQDIFFRLFSFGQSTLKKFVDTISNKYQAATEKLIAHYFPTIRFIAVFGQREGVNVKPDPTVVYDILKIAKTAKEDVLYVGDSGVDMQTAIHANITSCGVTWGFRPRAELETFHFNFISIYKSSWPNFYYLCQLRLFFC